MATNAVSFVKYAETRLGATTEREVMYTPPIGDAGFISTSLIRESLFAAYKMLQTYEVLQALGGEISPLEKLGLTYLETLVKYRLEISLADLIKQFEEQERGKVD